MSIEYLSAVQLGKLVNKREISCREVLEFFKDRIEKRNPSINAFVYTKFDEAFECAEAIQNKIMKGEYVGPFAGVPVGLKDFLPAKKGWTASHGGVKSFITVDSEDCTFWKAAEKLGCIAVGKTNAPSFGFRGTTYNKMYGNTNNPFNLSYNSGGSSGGSCAAVGGLLVPLASCGDAGGSTRVPSAWCNCFGFKPSAGLVPSICRPDAWTATHPYCCDGPTARTVKDAAFIMDNMMEYDPKDPISVPLQPKNFAFLDNGCLEHIKQFKIAVTYNYNLFPFVDSQISDAVYEIAELFSDLGATVEYVNFEFNHTLDDMVEAWLRSISVDSAVDMELMKQSGFDLIGDYAEDLPEQFIKWAKIAYDSTMMDYRKFHEIRTDILDANIAILSDYDLILSPVTSCMPVLNSEDDTKGPSSMGGEDTEQLIGFCQTWLQNMTGNPAASVPAKLGSNNLPIGVQIVGRRYRDEDVFTAAYVIEKMRPWTGSYRKIIDC